MIRKSNEKMLPKEDVQTTIITVHLNAVVFVKKLSHIDV